MPQQPSYRPIGELAKDGDVVFAPKALPIASDEWWR